MVQRNGSDLYFSTGACPHIKIGGQTVAIGETRLGAGDVSSLAYSIMVTSRCVSSRAPGCNPGDFGRRTRPLPRQRLPAAGDVAMVIRFIKAQIPVSRSCTCRSC